MRSDKPVSIRKGDNHGEQGTKGKKGKEKEEEREAKAAQEVTG
jgi:hypothetical protein